MALLNGMHHLTFLTADLDRLIDFYGRVFDAPVTLDLEEEGLRHAFIQIGPHTVLHPFQIPGVEVPQASAPMFQRGRIDHFALDAASEEAFREIYRRLLSEGGMSARSPTWGRSCSSLSKTRTAPTRRLPGPNLVCRSSRESVFRNGLLLRSSDGRAGCSAAKSPGPLPAKLRMKWPGNVSERGAGPDSPNGSPILYGVNR